MNKTYCSHKHKDTHTHTQTHNTRATSLRKTTEMHGYNIYYHLSIIDSIYNPSLKYNNILRGLQQTLGTPYTSLANAAQRLGHSPSNGKMY